MLNAAHLHHFLPPVRMYFIIAAFASRDTSYESGPLAAFEGFGVGFDGEVRTDEK